MPLYDFLCGDCGALEIHREYADRDAPLDCPHCDAELSRVWLSAPRLSVGSTHARRAASTNERASEEPLRSRDLDPGHRHHAGCGCRPSGAPSRPAATAADGAKSFPGRRPWMISH